MTSGVLVSLEMLGTQIRQAGNGPRVTQERLGTSKPGTRDEAPRSHSPRTVRPGAQSRACSRDTAKPQVRGSPPSNILGTKEGMGKWSHSATRRPTAHPLESARPLPLDFPQHLRQVLETAQTSDVECSEVPSDRPGSVALSSHPKEVRQEE